MICEDPNSLNPTVSHQATKCSLKGRLREFPRFLTNQTVSLQYRTNCVLPRGRSDVVLLFRFLSQICTDDKIKELLFPSSTRAIFLSPASSFPTKSHYCPSANPAGSTPVRGISDQACEDGGPKRGLWRIQADRGSGLLRRRDLVRLHHPRRSTRDLVIYLFLYFVFLFMYKQPLVKPVWLQTSPQCHMYVSTCKVYVLGSATDQVFEKKNKLQKCSFNNLGSVS